MTRDEALEEYSRLDRLDGLPRTWEPYVPAVLVEPEVFIPEKSVKTFVYLLGAIQGCLGVVIVAMLVAGIMGWHS